MTEYNKISIEFDKSHLGPVVRAVENIGDSEYLIWSNAAIEGPLADSIPTIVVKALIDEVDRLRSTYEPEV